MLWSGRRAVRSPLVETEVSDDDDLCRRAVDDREPGRGDFGIDPGAAPVDGNAELEDFLTERLRARALAFPRPVAERQEK